MSVPPTSPAAGASLQQLNVQDIDPNEGNPRLEFPQGELDRLAESIDLEGILVPIVVYQKGVRFVLVDGERRYKCAKTLGLTEVPALVTEPRPDDEVLVQMFNIHLIREPWRDMPTGQGIETACGRSGVQRQRLQPRSTTGLDGPLD